MQIHDTADSRLVIALGQPPMLLALPVIFTASCTAFLLPLDAVALITYSRGYYRMTDMLWPGPSDQLLLGDNLDRTNDSSLQGLKF